MHVKYLYFRAAEAGIASSIKLILSLSPGHCPLPNLHSGDTPLLVACQKRNHEIANLLLAHSPKLLLIQSKLQRHSALHLAASSGDVQMVYLLLRHVKYLLVQGELTNERSYTLDFLDAKGVTPLFAACNNDHTKIVKAIIDLQNEFSTTRLIDVSRVLGEGKRTLLHVAVQNCNLAIVKVLLSSRDVDVNVLAKLSKDTYQHLIGSYSESRHDPTVNPGRRPATSGQLPLESSLKSGKSHDIEKKHDATVIISESEVVITNVNLVASKSVKDSCDIYVTPLVDACAYGSKAIVELLLQHGAVDKDGLACRICRFLKNFDLEQMVLSYHCTYDVINTDQQKKKPGTEPSLGLELQWNSKNLPACNRAWLSERITYFTTQVSTESISKSVSVSAECGDIRLAVHDYSSIKVVNLSENNLSEVPLELFCLPNVIEINLSHNKVTTLPVNQHTCLNTQLYGWDCMRLEVLNLSYNGLTELPSCIWMLPNLREIHGQVNRLSTIPVPSSEEDISKISNSLDQINISKNRLELLPVIVWIANSLKELDLSDNHLNISGLNFPSWQVFKGSIREYEHKDSESLAMRYHTHVHSKSVSKSNEVLSFGFTRNIEFFEWNYSSLQKLVISNNHLTEFPEALPCVAPNLQELDVSNNTFECIDIQFIPQLIINFKARNCKIWRFGNVLTKTQHALIVTNCCSIFDKATKSELCQHRSHRQLPFLKVLDLRGNNLTHIQLLYHPPVSHPDDDPTAKEEKYNECASSTTLLYPDLRILNLEQNNLTGLFNPNIGHQSELKSLSLSGNMSLERLPNELGMLNLMELDIQDTPNLVDPPLEYQNLESLDHLSHLLCFLKARMRK